MLVQLYTSRVVLEVLGIDDYGIWCLVASLVVSISFITGPLSTATQRFLSYEIGKGNEKKTNTIFSQSLILYAIFSAILLILLETIGLWLLNTKLNIPESKITTTNIVFQLSILSFIVTLMRMPYDSMIIAYEKMDFYAYMSILDVGLKLAIVYMLSIVNSFPHLVVYAILTLCVTIVITIAYKLFCNHKFISSRARLAIDRPVIKEMASFSGWSLMGAFAVMTSNQGVSMVLNVFFGVAINATMGITNQVGNAVNQFVSNFQLAFNPQIVKMYAQGEYTELKNLIYKASRFSFLLMLAIAFPIIYNIDEILYLWLGDNVPEYTGIFCTLMIVSFLFDSLSAPLYMTIQATGKIRKYQVLISSILLSNIILSYVALNLNFPPVSVMIIRCFISICCIFTRYCFTKKQLNFQFKNYSKNVLLPCFTVTVLCLCGGHLLDKYLIESNNLFICGLRIVILFTYYTVIMFLGGVSASERHSIIKMLKNKFKYVKKHFVSWRMGIS